MRDRPDGQDLLETARRVLREELIPFLPEDKRYAALMAANAMAIARRQLAADPSEAERERQSLARILGADGPPENLIRLLARRIRAGEHDGDAAVFGHLLETTLTRVRESNPGYLERNGISAPKTSMR